MIRLLRSNPFVALCVVLDVGASVTYAAQQRWRLAVLWALYAGCLVIIGSFGP